LSAVEHFKIFESLTTLLLKKVVGEQQNDWAQVIISLIGKTHIHM